MNFRTLLSPDKALALGLKVFVAIFCILMALLLVSEILIVFLQMSFFNLVFTGFLFTLLSVGAYYIRAARKTRQTPQRPARGSERTPILPYREENE